MSPLWLDELMSISQQQMLSSILQTGLFAMVKDSNCLRQPLNEYCCVHEFAVVLLFTPFFTLSLEKSCQIMKASWWTVYSISSPKLLT